MKKIETINFDGYEPNVTELSEILPKAGFRPLISATEEDLPVGALALIYSKRNHTLTPIIIWQASIRTGFSYICVEQMYKDPDVEYLDTHASGISELLFKVVMQLPVEGNHPNLEMLPNCIEEAKFKELAKATQESLPEGSVALLYSIKSKVLLPVIVRKMSVSNERFLYLHQAMACNWIGNVKIGLKTLKNYSYLVVS